ncbi:uncharacterized protein LOC106881952 [Octopus bimaculoides]|uniref:uncharacterized protein LOC106881952 n=1 Tax=Octopus bimaculoides TaxID=37653 RepID=UPI00071D9A50|nr:uncharacterized protein LOC106881952 [Octopus bimaculoides]|eukprot:XP_014787969.1 PREDICTED: uncharacterized protein LOC106881952 [Octopus bimaculoides]
MDVVALTETRIHGKGNFVEKSTGYHLFWSSREETYKRESGVGFAIKTILASKLEELPCGHSDCLMSLRLPLRKGHYATVISAYAPTMNSSEDDKLAFYLSFAEIIRNIPHDDKVVILGDFNACVGADWETWGVLGKHGVGSSNSNVYGPVSSKVVPLQSKDGTELLTNPKDIVGRWKEHSDELLNRPTEVDLSFRDNIPERPIKHLIAEVPSLAEIKAAIRKLNNGKAPGMDGLGAEIYKYGGDHLCAMLTDVIQRGWQNEEVPLDWRDATMEILYKSKGGKDVWDNYCGIYLLAVAGKVLCRVMLDRFLLHIADEVLPESQCGFRDSRSTMDMIFSARQLQEKCIEQDMDLYQDFIDLTKAFDSINRIALWEILKKLGCPEKFVRMLRQFHDKMEVRVNVGGTLSDPISV